MTRATIGGVSELLLLPTGSSDHLGTFTRTGRTRAWNPLERTLEHPLQAREPFLELGNIRLDTLETLLYLPEAPLYLLETLLYLLETLVYLLETLVYLLETACLPARNACLPARNACPRSSQTS